MVHNCIEAPSCQISSFKKWVFQIPGAKIKWNYEPEILVVWRLLFTVIGRFSVDEKNSTAKKQWLAIIAKYFFFFFSVWVTDISAQWVHQHILEYIHLIHGKIAQQWE